jgi:hypothetical protein
MAELIQLDIAEALKTREYPILLRERRLLLSEKTLNAVLGLWIALVAVVYCVAVFWFGATRVQQHALEIASVILGAGVYIVLKEMRREHVLEISAAGVRLRPHSASAPTDIAWSDILSVKAEDGEVILVRRGEVPYEYRLLGEGFDFRDLASPHFDANVSEIAELLEVHRSTNTMTAT